LEKGKSDPFSFLGGRIFHPNPLKQQRRKQMKNILARISMTLLLVSFVVLVKSTVSAAECADTTTLVAGGSSGAICSSAAFTSGAKSTIKGNVSAKAAVTLDATSHVIGSVTAGAGNFAGFARAGG
jgi:predicted acyltransferase (DUF342 family)